MAFLSQPFVSVPLVSGTTPDEIKLAKDNNVIERSFSVWASPSHWYGVVGWGLPNQGDTGKYWSDPYTGYSENSEDLPYVVLDPSNSIDTTKPGWEGHASWSIYGYGFYNFIRNYKSRFHLVPGLKVINLKASEASRMNLEKPNASQVPFCRGDQFRSDLGLRFNFVTNKIEAFEWQEFANRNKSDYELGR